LAFSIQSCWKQTKETRLKKLISIQFRSNNSGDRFAENSSGRFSLSLSQPGAGLMCSFSNLFHYYHYYYFHYISCFGIFFLDWAGIARLPDRPLGDESRGSGAGGGRLSDAQIRALSRGSSFYSPHRI